MSRLYMQQETEQVDQGHLLINIRSETGEIPIEGATIRLSYTGQPDSILETLSSDVSGQTEDLLLATPPLEYSMEPGQNQPYAEYTIEVTADGYEPVNISGIELLPNEQAIQNVLLTPLAETPQAQERIVIGPHTLYGDYPPKIPEDEIKSISESGEIVLSRVVVPEYVVVHDGPPSDTSATDYYVRFRDYIKNVASSEIYATWSDSTIRANVLAILSFTLNRVFTEWYRNKGYDFTITSSTAYDHKWIHGRNVFENISYIVDEIFANYLSRPNVKQPILTQYCDGQQVQCLDRGWMTQWGSKYLGDQGYTPIDIIRYYYGDNMYINTAEQISGIPASWPGYDLSIGSSGTKVRQMQQQLDRIAQTYTNIPRITADGIYGPATAEAVRAFQRIFNLPVTGVVDYPTWYEISGIYVAITRIGELYP